MDTLVHAIYGATLFSRSGLAGGLRGAARADGRCGVDWTVWAAFGFGLLPDIASIGVYFAQLLLDGRWVTFHDIPPYVFVLYNATHSLLVAAAVLAAFWFCCRPLALPALAWPFHLLSDIFTHARGRFETPFLYPLSDYAFDGLNWWQHPWLTRLAWGLLPVLWIGLALARRAAARSRGPGAGPAAAEPVR